MQFNRTIRRVVPICSMLLALGTVAFQAIENSQEKSRQEKINQNSLDTENQELLSEQEKELSVSIID